MKAQGKKKCVSEQARVCKGLQQGLQGVNGVHAAATHELLF
jgi:hypothetical protein